jgi:hypothetical protein
MEVLISSPLYFQKGCYFSEGEFIAADGGFEGDVIEGSNAHTKPQETIRKKYFSP